MFNWFKKRTIKPDEEKYDIMAMQEDINIPVLKSNHVRTQADIDDDIDYFKKKAILAIEKGSWENAKKMIKRLEIIEDVERNGGKNND